MRTIVCRKHLGIWLGLLVWGCASGGAPSLQSTPAARYGKIVVAAVRMPPQVREAAEARLRDEISKRGVEVIPLSSLEYGDEPRTPKVLVQKILQAGAQAVFVLDPFVFEEGGRPVVKTVILSGLREIHTNEVVANPPVTYKAALYDVDKVVRVWMNDVNSTEQEGRGYGPLATDAATEAVSKAVEAGVL